MLENILSNILKNFRIFESIKKIQEPQPAAENSSFFVKVIIEEGLKNAIKDLPINKSTISREIPTIKQYAQIYFKKLANILKKAEVTPVCKKGDMNDKQNYRPVCINSPNI